jgi:hypothetical protein
MSIQGYNKFYPACGIASTNGINSTVRAVDVYIFRYYVTEVFFFPTKSLWISDYNQSCLNLLFTLQGNALKFSDFSL